MGMVRDWSSGVRGIFGTWHFQCFDSFIQFSIVVSYHWDVSRMDWKTMYVIQSNEFFLMVPASYRQEVSCCARAGASKTFCQTWKPSSDKNRLLTASSKCATSSNMLWFLDGKVIWTAAMFFVDHVFVSPTLVIAGQQKTEDGSRQP